MPKRKNRKSKSKLHGAHKVKSAIGRSHSRRDCKACNDVQMMNMKAQPVKFTHDFERLQYFVKLYQQFAKAGKITNAIQCISKIKANHPILFRL